jgi:RNA polymerase sigma-70 factor, ECF subfamily
VEQGELDGLMQVLSDDVELWVDGGGKAQGAVTSPLHGRTAVAQFLSATRRRANPDARTEIADVNGEPALIVRAGGEVRLVLSIGIDQGRVCAIRAIRNPDKLQNLKRALQATEREPSSES